MTPRVTVILPYYNAENTLALAIESILEQSFEDFEFLLIDNVSTDRSKEIAAAFNDSRIAHLTENTKGVVHAANLGLEKANGEFIARMDADDISEPWRLEQQLSVFTQDKAIDVVSGLVKPIADPTEGFEAYLNWSNSILDPDEIYASQFIEYPLVNPSIMFRSSLIEKFGAYRDGDFPEDYEFFLRLMSAGVQMKKLNRTVLRWNDLSCRLTRTSNAYTEEAFNRIKSKYLGDWLRKHSPFGPNIWIWGAGKQARLKSRELEQYGVQIEGYIDVSSKRHSEGLPVIHFESLPTVPDRFIVSYVGNRGAREDIKAFLIGRGWREMEDFVLAS